MNVRGRWIIIAANLVVLVVLAFVYPHLMVSPGPLIPGHASLTTDCFACHAPLRGAATERCIACHTVADIGQRTTDGTPKEPIEAGGATRVKLSFHQELIEKDCMACHSDHAGPKLTKRSRNPFSHELLQQGTRTQCDSCHMSPDNAMHRRVKVGCVQCHSNAGWRPASFDHEDLPKAELNRCEACHNAPSDKLHRQINGGCAQCHSPKAWEPATFDHDKYFRLDRDHNAPCATCHVENNYSQYTCYGCHEHTLNKVRREHAEEGIRNFENCVKCHRSADDD